MKKCLFSVFSNTPQNDVVKNFTKAYFHSRLIWRGIHKYLMAILVPEKCLIILVLKMDVIKKFKSSHPALVTLVNTLDLKGTG